MRSCSRRSFELLAGAGALGEGLREPALLERLGGLAEVLAALLDLLPRLGHPLLVLLALHPLAQLVGVAEDLLLLVAEPLELALDLLAGLLRLRRLEGRLQLLEPLVEVALPLGQLAEPVEHLPVLGLLRARAASGSAASGRCAAPRSGSHRGSGRAGGAAAAIGCWRTPAAAALLRRLRMTWNSRARSFRRRLVGGLLGGKAGWRALIDRARPRPGRGASRRRFMAVERLFEARPSTSESRQPLAELGGLVDHGLLRRRGASCRPRRTRRSASIASRGGSPSRCR